ncbi:type IV secretion system DNA-binding domain-containing protein, partial [Escherichia coli]
HGWLWVTSNARQHESLKPLISMWLAQAANCLLGMGENLHRRVWFIYDELPSLNKLPELPGVLAEARRFGGCFVLGFQAKAQMDFTYGKETADAMLGLVNTRFFFRSPSSTEAEWVQREIGQRRDKVFSEQYSYGADTVRDGVSFSKVEEDRYLVNYTDIQKLPNLSCYVTFPGDYPAVRMSMRYEKIKDCAEDLQMREINDSLDPEIESEISRREEEEGDITALLARLEQGEARKDDEQNKTESQAGQAESLNNPVLAAAVTQVAAAAVTGGTGESNPVEEKMPVAELTEIVDKETGEILYPGDERYEELCRDTCHAQEAMRQDERNLVTHQTNEAREQDDDREVTW